MLSIFEIQKSKENITRKYLKVRSKVWDNFW